MSNYTYTIGRRKTSTATIRLYIDKGVNEINGKDWTKVYTSKFHQDSILEPFVVANLDPKKYMFTVQVKGGGVSSQLGAIKHALARAIVKSTPETKSLIKKAGLLTRDPRMVERKKAGLHKARKAEQYSKR